MAAIILNGFIDNIHYNPNGSVIVYVSEFKKGYRHKNGTIVEDKYISWRCIFKQGLKKYINEHFSNRMYVEVKGDILPYAIDDDKIVDGYSLIGQTLNLSSFPRLYAKDERKMMKESQLNCTDKPDLKTYNEPDF